MSLKLSVLPTELPGKRNDGGDIVDAVVFDIKEAAVNTVGWSSSTIVFFVTGVDNEVEVGMF